MPEAAVAKARSGTLHVFEPAFQQGFTKGTCSRCEPELHRLAAEPRLVQLRLGKAHMLADSPSHTFRKLASGAGPSTSTTAQVSPSIVVIIIVLTVIFFLSAFLHLLIRWLARNPALIRRGMRAGSANGGAASNNRIIALTAIHGQLQQLFSMQDAGLERSLIDELPVFSYKAAMAGLKEGADCAICLCEFVVDDDLRLLPSCGHAFHIDCIDTWLLSHSTCPLCRTLLLPECWLPGSLQPLLSSEVSILSDAEHPHLAVNPLAVPVHSYRSIGLGSSSRRSSFGHFPLAAASNLATSHSDQTQSHEHLHAEPPLLMPNLVASVPSSDAVSANRTSTNSSRECNFSNEESQNFTDVGKLDTSPEAKAGMAQATKMDCTEATSSVLRNAMPTTSVAAMSDSSRLSHSSLGNNTDAQSGRFNSNRLERASAYGSGRRISVHLGKCREANEQNGHDRKSTTSRGSFTRGFYEYVIDNSASLEVLIPPHSRANTLISSARYNDLLNLSHRVQSSLAVDDALPTLGSDNVTQDVISIWNLSPKVQCASNSFRELRLLHEEDTAASKGEEMNAPLSSFGPLHNSDGWNERHADLAKCRDLKELNKETALTLGTNCDASFCFKSASQMYAELDELCKGEAGKDSLTHGSSKRAASFRLPTPASHHVLNAKLRASASRRALSDIDDTSWYWEPSLTTEGNIELGNERENQMLIMDNKARLHQSTRFAKRTMDWLVGWPRRMVHPDKSLANTG